MKSLCIRLTFLLAIVAVMMPVIVTAAPDPAPILSPTPTQFVTLTFETPPRVTIPPVQTSRPGSGEVEVPITRTVTPIPTIPRTAVTTPTFEPTTVFTPPTIPRTVIPTTLTLQQTVPPTPTVSRTIVPTTPTFQQTTVPETPASPQTTVSATQTVPPSSTTVPETTTVPVVTVTVLVFPSGQVYYPENYLAPEYYYSPGYPYSNYPRGSLTVTSNPTGAYVIVDGYNSAITPHVFTGLTTGYHTVEVDYPGYEAYITNVYMDNGAGIQVYADLVNLVNYGSLFVDSTPRGADVYVDGNYQGTSPVTVSSLSEGPHQVELHLAGYEVLTQTEEVVAGQATVANPVMVSYSSSSGVGSIDITSNVPGALVYLDGVYKGSTQSQNSFNVIAVSPGSHTLLLSVPGYADFTQAVQVNPGQISYVNAVFTPSSPVPQSPVTPATGSITATSVPSGGQVYVDNQFRGIAPVTIYNVATGTHIVNMKLAGYDDWSTSVDVQANQVVQVSAIFVPGSGTTPVPTRAGVAPFAFIGALGVIILLSRARR